MILLRPNNNAKFQEILIKLLIRMVFNFLSGLRLVVMLIPVSLGISITQVKQLLMDCQQGPEM